MRGRTGGPTGHGGIDDAAATVAVGASVVVMTTVAAGVVSRAILAGPSAPGVPSPASCWMKGRYCACSRSPGGGVAVDGLVGSTVDVGPWRRRCGESDPWGCTGSRVSGRRRTGSGGRRGGRCDGFTGVAVGSGLAIPAGVAVASGVEVAPPPFVGVGVSVDVGQGTQIVAAVVGVRVGVGAAVAVAVGVGAAVAVGVGEGVAVGGAQIWSKV